MGCRRCSLRGTGCWHQRGSRTRTTRIASLCGFSEMWSTPQVCTERDCGQPSAQGSSYCPAHQQDNARIRQRREYDKHNRAPWHRWYGLAVWLKLRAWFLTKPEHVICEWIDRNGQRCTRPTAEVDHIVPHRGNWALFIDPKNLQGLCSSHHALKTAKEDGGFGRNQCSRT